MAAAPISLTQPREAPLPKRDATAPVQGDPQAGAAPAASHDVVTWGDGPDGKKFPNLQKAVDMTAKFPVVGGPARAALGVIQVVDAKNKGDVVEGLRQTAVGVLSFVAGSLRVILYSSDAAALTGLAGLSKAGRSVAFAVGGNALLGWTAGTAAMLKGVKDVYDGHEAGDKRLEVGGGGKMLAGAVMFAGAATVNPLIIGAGSVLYGIACAYEKKDDIIHFVQMAPEKAREVLDRVKSLVHHGSPEKASATAPIDEADAQVALLSPGGFRPASEAQPGAAAASRTQPDAAPPDTIKGSLHAIADLI